MSDYGVACVATGPAVNPVELGSSLAELLTTLQEFGAFGRFENDGTGYEATLAVTATSPDEAAAIALRAMSMAAASARMPGWSISVRETFELPPKS